MPSLSTGRLWSAASDLGLLCFPMSVEELYGSASSSSDSTCTSTLGSTEYSLLDPSTFTPSFSLGKQEKGRSWSGGVFFYPTNTDLSHNWTCSGISSILEGSSCHILCDLTLTFSTSTLLPTSSLFSLTCFVPLSLPEWLYMYIAFFLEFSKVPCICSRVWLNLSTFQRFPLDCLRGFSTR